MNIHKNARLTPHGRERIVLEVLRGQTPQAASRVAGVCAHTVRKWVARYQAGGVGGLQDRSSRPPRLYRPTPPPAVARIEALRRERRSGKPIVKEVGVSPAAARMALIASPWSWVS